MYVAYFEYENREPEKVEFSFQPSRKARIRFRNFQNEIVALNITDKAGVETGVGTSNFVTFRVRINENASQYQDYNVVTPKGVYKPFGVERSN